MLLGLALCYQDKNSDSKEKAKWFSLWIPHFLKASFGFNFFYIFPFIPLWFILPRNLLKLVLIAKRFPFPLHATSPLSFLPAKIKFSTALQGFFHVFASDSLSNRSANENIWKNDIARHYGDWYNVIFHPHSHSSVAFIFLPAHNDTSALFE